MGALTIDAAVIERPGEPFRFEQLSMDPPGPDQVRVRIRACGVCHTDMVMRDGDLPVPFPVILGHEGAGVVEAVGRDVAGLSKGDHVLLSFHSCGACAACRDHEPGYCDEFVPRNFLGLRQPGEGSIRRGEVVVGSNIFGQSAFATYALAHMDNVVRIDADLPLDLLAPLGCGVQTGAGTVLETLDVQPGQSIAIMGAGAVGLSAVMAAKIADAGRICVRTKWRKPCRRWWSLSIISSTRRAFRRCCSSRLQCWPRAGHWRWSGPIRRRPWPSIHPPS